MPHHTLQAIIFDMDGLLIDSELCWEQARRNMAAEYGQAWTAEEQRHVMGVSTATWANYMIERLGLKMTPQALIERIVSDMQAIYRRQIPFMPGAIRAVRLAASHYPTGLASGSERRLIETVVNDAALHGQFQVVVCSDELAHGKPAADIYLETARQLGLAAEACVCVEDSSNGILAGKAAGMQVIAVPDERFQPNQEVIRQADIVLNSLEEFSIEQIKAGLSK